MLFVIDVGNTNIVMGIYKGSKLVKNWRIRTEKNTTADEFNVLATNLFSQGKMSLKKLKKPSSLV
jgi:type III pantothenate kinase